MAYADLSIHVDGVPDTWDPAQFLNDLDVWLQAKGFPYNFSLSVTLPTMTFDRHWEPPG